MRVCLRTARQMRCAETIAPFYILSLYSVKSRVHSAQALSKNAKLLRVCWKCGKRLNSLQNSINKRSVARGPVAQLG
jgi:hypothetical protein